MRYSRSRCGHFVRTHFSPRPRRGRRPTPGKPERPARPEHEGRDRRMTRTPTWCASSTCSPSARGRIRRMPGGTTDPRPPPPQAPGRGAESPFPERRPTRADSPAPPTRFGRNSREFSRGCPHGLHARAPDFCPLALARCHTDERPRGTRAQRPPTLGTRVAVGCRTGRSVRRRVRRDPSLQLQVAGYRRMNVCRLLKAIRMYRMYAYALGSHMRPVAGRSSGNGNRVEVCGDRGAGATWCGEWGGWLTRVRWATAARYRRTACSTCGKSGGAATADMPASGGGRGSKSGGSFRGPIAADTTGNSRALRHT